MYNSKAIGRRNTRLLSQIKNVAPSCSASCIFMDIRFWVELGCMIKVNCPLVGPGLIVEVSSGERGIFLRDPSPQLHELRKKPLFDFGIFYCYYVFPNWDSRQYICIHIYFNIKAFNKDRIINICCMKTFEKVDWSK